MLLWPLVAVLGFVVLSGLVVALATRSTAQYEFERNRVQSARPVPVPAPAETLAVPEEQPAPAASGSTAPELRSQTSGAVAVATLPATVPIPLPDLHPAGGPGTDGGDQAWWLVRPVADRPSGDVVAGPFPDRVAAEWAAVATQPAATVDVVHGARSADGRLVRRQSPEERAWLADLGEQLDRLPADWDERLDDDDPLVTLVVEIAAALVEAGLQLHDCAGEAAAGGVCLTPDPGRGGVLVSWHQHDRMSRDRVRGADAAAAVQGVLQDAVADCLEELGFPVEDFGTSGAALVTPSPKWC